MSEIALDDEMVAQLFGEGGQRDEAAMAVVSDRNLAGYADALSDFMLTETESVSPPTGLKSKVLEAVSAAAAAAAGREAPGDEDAAPSKILRFPVIPWAAAACFAILAGILLNRVSDLKQSVAEIGGRLEVRESESEKLAGLLGVQIPDEATVVLLEHQGGAIGTALAIWDSVTQKVTLRGLGLAPLDPSISDYQLWIVDPQYDVPVDGGIFQVSENGEMTHTFSAPLQVDTAAAFAVTKEVVGGVKVSKGPHLLLGAAE